MLRPMKPSPAPNPHANRARAVLSPSTRPQPPRTMRSTVLMSLLLAPDGGITPHRHGQSARRARTS
jgi:hypothetical protein